MKKYERPDMLVAEFDITDIIVTSGLIAETGTPDITTPGGKDDLEWNSINLND